MPSGPFVHLAGPGPLLGIEIHSHTRQLVWMSYSRDIESEDRAPAVYATQMALKFRYGSYPATSVTRQKLRLCALLDHLRYRRSPAYHILLERGNHFSLVRRMAQVAA